MAKKNYDNSNVLQMLESNREAALKASKSVGEDYTLTAKGDFVKTFDYIKEYTGEKMSLATSPDIVQQNYINAQYAEGKKNSQDQGFWGELAAFSAQTVAGEIVMGSLEGAGYLLDIQHWGSKLMGGEGDWGNWFSDYMDQGKSWLREATPIYQDPDNIGRSTWENMLHGDGWWAENGVSIASSLSVLIPVAGWARGVGLAGKGLNYIGQAGRIGKLGQTAAKTIKTVDKVMDIFPPVGEATSMVISGIHKATVSRLIESQMEATAVYKDRYQYYTEVMAMDEESARKAAGDAASTTYNWNWLALATDIPQYMLLGGAGKRLKGMLHSKKPGFIQNSNLLNKTAGLRATASTMFTEGLEESYQYMVSEEGKRMGDIHAGIVDPNDSTLGERIGKYMQESELTTSAVFGALGGGIFKTAGPAATNLINKAFRKGEMRMTEKDLRVAEARDRYTKLSHNMDLINQAEKTGDEEAMFAAKGNLAFQLARDAVMAGNWTQARSAMAQMKNATKEEQEYYNLGDNFDKFATNIDSWMEHMDVAADIIDRATSKYTYGLSEAVARRKFDKYMYDKMSPELQQKRTEELRNSISNFDSLSKDGNVAVEEAINIRGMELAIKNLEKLATQEKNVEDKSAMEAQIEKGKEYISQRKEAIKKITDDSDALTDDDQLALETVRGGSADDAVRVDAKMKIMDFQNQKNLKELNYLTSRDGIRDFKRQRDLEYKRRKEEARKKAESEEVAQSKRDTVDPNAAQTKKQNVKDLNITKVAEQIAKGEKTFEDFTDDPDELYQLKQAVANWQMLQDEHGDLIGDEAEEEGILLEEDEIVFSEEDLVEEVTDESDGEIDPTLQRDASGDLNEELAAADAHEEIEIPENHSTDRGWRVGDDLENPTLSSIPAQLGWLSANNELASEVTPEQRALTTYLENPGNPIQEVELRFQVNLDYIKKTKNPKHLEMLRQMSAGILPSNADIGFLPIEGILMKSGKPIEVGGHQLKMSLHDPDFFFKKNGDPKNPGISEYQSKVAILHKKAIVKQIMSGGVVTTKLAHKSNGKLNIRKQEDGRYPENFVAQTLKKPIDRVSFLVGDNSGYYVTPEGGRRMSQLSSAESGAIYVETNTANGSKFPLRLKVSNISEAEGNVIHRIYLDMLNNPQIQNLPISDGIKEYFETAKDSRIKEMTKFLDMDNITYQELLDELVYEGSRTLGHKTSTLTHFVNVNIKGQALPNVVQFGDTKLPAERLSTEEGKAQFISWITENKRRQVNRKRLADPTYKTYINDTKIVSTNVQATSDGNLFIQPVVSYSTTMRVENAETKAVEAKEETVEETPIVDAVVETKGVAMFISKTMKQDLLDLGYSRNVISKMTPEEAHMIINEQRIAPVRETANTVKETIQMFQQGIKTEAGEEIKINMPEIDDFDENPC